MNSIMVIPQNLNLKLPSTSSFDLDMKIIHSMIGYDTVKINVTLFHGEEFAPSLNENLIKDYKYSNFNEIDSLLDEIKPDFVGIFTLDDLEKVIDKKISNLYVFVSQIPNNIPNQLQEYLSNDWVKVISFLPRSIINGRIKVDRYCTPFFNYLGDFKDVKLESHDGHNILIPIDGTIQSLYEFDLPINSIIAKIKEFYPESNITLAFLGARVFSEAPNVNIIGLQSLGEYLTLLLDSDLQVCIHTPNNLNLYPFYALSLGVRTAFFSQVELNVQNSYPYLPKEFSEILGVNDVEIQSNVEIQTELSDYLKSLSLAYDEIGFNLQLHTAIRCLDVNFREEYRIPFEQKLDEMEEFYKNHPEYTTIKPKNKEVKDEGDKCKVNN